MYKLKSLDKLEKKFVTINDLQYPILIDGSGKIPCICIGIGSLMQKTLSDEFKKIFTVYSMDLYWIEKNRIKNPKNLNLNQLIDDIFECIRQLKLDKPVLLAHSAYGILALEAAKLKNPPIRAIIMIGSPTGVDQITIKFINDYFEKNASLERKINDKLRKEEFAKIKKPDESGLSINAYEADTARYWGDFNIARKFLEEIWHDVQADDEIINHYFSKLLIENDLAIDMEKIKIPVILAGGQFDYDCLPLELWKTFKKPQNFTIIDCGKVGHWPNLENSRLFDQEIKKWIDSINKI